VTRPDLKRAIAELCGEVGYVAGGFHPFISSAPVLIIPCTSEMAYHRRYQEPDKLQRMAPRSFGRCPTGIWTSAAR
jgi:hypothetical protein